MVKTDTKSKWLDGALKTMILGLREHEKLQMGSRRSSISGCHVEVYQ